MQISFITKLRMPDERGLGSAIFAKCLAYHETKNVVELITPNRKQIRQLTNTTAWKYYQVKPGSFKIVNLPCLEMEVLNHFRHFVMSWTYSFFCLAYLWKNNRKVIHFYSECIELLALLWLVRLLYSPKIICEVHYEIDEKYTKLLEKFFLNRADLLLVTTKNMSRYCENLGISKGKIKILSEGVRIEDFDYKKSKKILRKKLDLPENKFIIGYGGRFVTAKMEKGIPELINAIAKLIPKYPNLLVVCVGGPQEYSNKYRQLAGNLGIFANALILDHVPPKTLYQYFQSFDICVLPFPNTKHFAHNMSPLKMFESMASKNPIIATDLPSIKEILTDGQNAVIVKPGNPKSLASGIEKLIKNERLRKTLAKNAFTLVSEKYTWKKRAITIMKIVG